MMSRFLRGFKTGSILAGCFYLRCSKGFMNICCSCVHRHERVAPLRREVTKGFATAAAAATAHSHWGYCWHFIHICIVRFIYTTLLSQKALSTDFISEQILPFVFEQQYIRPYSGSTDVLTYTPPHPTDPCVYQMLFVGWAIICDFGPACFHLLTLIHANKKRLPNVVCRLGHNLWFWSSLLPPTHTNPCQQKTSTRCCLKVGQRLRH